MAKKPALPKKLAGQTFAFVGTFGYRDNARADLETLVRESGGKVVDADADVPDLLVVGDKAKGLVTKVRKAHPQIQTIETDDLYRMTAPSAEEFLAVVRSGPHDYDFWNRLRNRIRHAVTPLDLAGTDFRGQTLEAVQFYDIGIDGCDFTGAMLKNVSFPLIKQAKFDNATMSDGSFSHAEDCSLKKVTMHDVRWNPAQFVRCDFTGATLNIRTGSYTTATECLFRNAVMRDADLDTSHFNGCDFRGADLSGANLHKTDFTDANLAGADLSRADLRNVNFTNADLRKAKLTDAILTGANFSGANIGSANFTGANLTSVTGQPQGKAKDFAPRAARQPGPHVLELAKIATASKRFQTLIELDLGTEGSVTLSPSWWNYGASNGYAGAGYSHETPTGGFGSSVDAPSFEQGMLNLVDRWSRGTPRFDSITVTAKKCPLKGKELEELAIAAWHEALGVPVPTAEERAQQISQSASDTETLRVELLAELTGGKAGVKRWNDRPDRERVKIGSLRGHDFTGAKLSGANLAHLDLRKANFAGVDLTGAHFYEANLQSASFVGANLDNAYLAACKAAEASFADAVLTHCNLRNASFRRCDFRGADLTEADFAHSDLCGADFSTATLKKTDFDRASYDEKTSFPAKFTPTKEMNWKGAGPVPGTPTVAPAVVGSMDFDAFTQRLAQSFDAARLDKARRMLKSERFQLFSDVSDEAVLGIVKSQSSKDLVYSCRIANDGAFGCCTQNLRPCGGLNGRLCKHLLVLIVGLTKAGRLDPATVCSWVDASQAKKPAIVEDAMSETFLKYKGAEAGEIDWRPTETLPEDFYAM